MAEKLFGTDGVRGRANVFPIVPDFALKLAQAISTLAVKHKKVAIAKDTRISGDMLEAAMISGFCSMGVDVELLGVIPTPALTFLTPDLKVDFAVMISASHNPYYDNGIKLINGNGDKLSDEQTSLLENLILKNEFVLSAEKLGKPQLNNKVIEKYLKVAKEVLPQNALKGLRVVLDCANGVFYEILPEIFKQFGAGVIVIGNQPDGYNINKECGSTDTKLLSQVVSETKAQLGVAVDGDGDRIIICDENGKKLDGDQIIAFLAKYFKEHKKLKGNAVVATILSNVGLESFVKSLGLNYHRTAVGERYVVQKMKELKANVGGEESGHMVLSDFSKSGDGMMAALIVAHGLLESGRKMSEIFPVFKPVPRLRVDVKFEKKEDIAKAMENAKVKKIIETSEQEIGNKGRILVRKSGTEPKVQVWVWCENKNLQRTLSQTIVEALSSLGGTPKEVA